MDNNLIGNQITKFRKARGLTQEELGRSVGVSTQAVSRWENGGAPDITLLPAIADRLGVSVDALFGREGTEGLDMEMTIQNWFGSMPADQIYQTLQKLIFSAVMSQSPIQVPDVHLGSCIEKNTGNMICSQILTDTGIYFGVNAQDMNWSAICPKPEEGYQAFFAENDRYRKLLTTLAMPGCLEIILHLLHQRRQFSTVELLARNSGIDIAVLEPALNQLDTFSLIRSLEIETLEGKTKAYSLNEDGSYIPFFYLLRHLADKADMNYINLNMNTKPLL